MRVPKNDGQTPKLHNNNPAQDSACVQSIVSPNRDLATVTQREALREADAVVERVRDNPRSSNLRIMMKQPRGHAMRKRGLVACENKQPGASRWNEKHEQKASRKGRRATVFGSSFYRLNLFCCSLVVLFELGPLSSAISTLLHPQTAWCRASTGKICLVLSTRRQHQVYSFHIQQTNKVNPPSPRRLKAVHTRDSQAAVLSTANQH